LANSKHAKRTASSARIKRRRAIVIGGALVVLLGGSYAAYALDGTSAKSSSKPTPTSTASTTPVANDVATCPLTGMPAPGGIVPARPALAIKVGNDPGARPQSGLTKADIVYEVQAEGGITRFIAVYQCHSPSLVGPIRSLRWVDWHVVAQLGHPILVYAGGIIPNLQQVKQQSWLFRVDALNYNGTPFVRTTNRVPPENLYGSPRKIWAMDPNHQAPSPVFSFSKTPTPGGTTISGVTIPYSQASDISWVWDPSNQAWERYYSGQPAMANSGVQLSATNVVVEFVNAPPGPYNESGPDSYGVRSQTIGSGPCWVLTDGLMYRCTWSRPSEFEPTTFEEVNGTKISLHPGNTWVEIVPNWVNATVQSSQAASTSSS
jgi:hypothetical protein